MVFSSIATLAILVVVVLAFRGAFGEFPDSWEWVSVVMASLSLVVGSHPLAQKIWGRPKVQVELEDYAEERARSLMIYIKNFPVQSRVLKMLGVKREAVQSLTVQYQIREAGSNRVILPIRSARIYSDDDTEGPGQGRISLPPTYSVGASVVFALWDFTNSVTLLPPRPPSREPEVLPPGLYVTAIMLTVDGEPKTLHRHFVVGPKADDLHWASADLTHK